MLIVAEELRSRSAGPSGRRHPLSTELYRRDSCAIGNRTHISRPSARGARRGEECGEAKSWARPASWNRRMTPHFGDEVVVSTSTYPWPRHLPTREEAVSGQSLACRASTRTEKAKSDRARTGNLQTKTRTFIVFSCTTHQSCFQILLLGCHFPSMVVEVGRAFGERKKRNIVGVTPVLVSSSILQILTAQLH